MNRSSSVLKMIGYPFASALALSLMVILVAMALLGFDFTEREGRWVGVIGTIGGVAGAVIGLKIAHRREHKRSKLTDTVPPAEG